MHSFVLEALLIALFFLDLIVFALAGGFFGLQRFGFDFSAVFSLPMSKVLDFSEREMVEKDDGLGLSLSLRYLQNQNSNPMPPPAPPPPAASPFPLNLLGCHFPFTQQHKCSSNDAFQSSVDRNTETRSLFGGIDVNRTLTVTDCDEEIIVSSPNSTLSSVSGKRSSEREENDAGERDSSSLDIDDDDDAEGRKKLRLCKEQAAVLEETFREHNTLNPKQKMALAKKLNLRPRQVEVWFQNRRARTKLKQTEVDCEYLRRCCENLTNENRRLQKEVNEFRALKPSPQFHMNMSPPTTLTMCPQCERLAVSSSSSSTNTTTTTGGRLATQHRHQQRPMSMTSWTGIITPQPLVAHRQGHNSLQE